MKNYIKYTKFFKEVALSKKWEKQRLKHIHFQQCLFMEQVKLFRLGPSKRGWPLWEFPSLGPFSLLSFLDLSSLTLSSFFFFLNIFFNNRKNQVMIAYFYQAVSVPSASQGLVPVISLQWLRQIHHRLRELRLGLRCLPHPGS